jgi:hypothetical protein
VRPALARPPMGSIRMGRAEECLCAERTGGARERPQGGRRLVWAVFFLRPPSVVRTMSAEPSTLPNCLERRAYMDDGREEAEFTSVCRKCGDELAYHTTLPKIEKTLPSLIVFKCRQCTATFMVSALASIRL